MSNYIDRPLRDLCRCGRGPVRTETEVCQACELDAQGNVVDLDQERAFRHVLRVMAGDDHG